MTDWVMAATTINCDEVADEVTIIVRKEGPVTCTGCDKYYESGKKTKKTSSQTCAGLECHRVTQYRDRLLAEGTKSGEIASE